VSESGGASLGGDPEPRSGRLLPCLALGGLLATSACCLPVTVTGQIVTQDRVARVPCSLGVWGKEIGPLDGKGTPVATGAARSGEVFYLDVSVGGPRLEERLYWVTLECAGYHLRVRALEWLPRDCLFGPVVDLGRVWLPKDRGAQE
jgi:hypothetical protein